MHKVTPEELGQATPKQLEHHISALQHDRDSIGYFFDVFFESLTYAEMGDDTSTPEWVLYRKMKDLYDRTDQLIRSANYYLGQA